MGLIPFFALATLFAVGVRDCHTAAMTAVHTLYAVQPPADLLPPASIAPSKTVFEQLVSTSYSVIGPRESGATLYLVKEAVTEELVREATTTLTHPGPVGTDTPAIYTMELGASHLHFHVPATTTEIFGDSQPSEALPDIVQDCTMDLDNNEGQCVDTFVINKVSNGTSGQLTTASTRFQTTFTGTLTPFATITLVSQGTTRSNSSLVLRLFTAVVMHLYLRTLL